MQFFVGTHNYHPLPQDTERVGARPPAARASILYCQSNVLFEQVFNTKSSHMIELIISCLLGIIDQPMPFFRIREGGIFGGTIYSCNESNSD